ncbi:MAG: alkaline phosphatase family protein [Haloarculaceae archaeon]
MAGGDSGAGRVVVLDVVGLQPEHVTAERTPALSELFAESGSLAELEPAFPALTVPAQTTLATGRSPATHGDVASGEYDRERDAVEFWGRQRDGRQRLWETASDAGRTTGALCFQHLIGSDADVAVTPSPIEDEHNDLIEMDCWSRPPDFYDHLRAKLGHFPLHEYWGPGADEGASRWILDAAGEAVDRHDPDLLWVYVPHLDYAGLADGPESRRFSEALATVDDMLGAFLADLRGDDRWAETAVALVSEYGFHAVETVAYPNRALRDAGLLAVADDGAGGRDVDLDASAAFAMVDHQLAHVYADGDAVPAAREALTTLDGVDAVLTNGEKEAWGLEHPNAGDLVLVAEPDAWFQYYWWTDRADAPSYATRMEIHEKPGFDPCELFSGDDSVVSLDPTRVGGSHGRVDPETRGALGLAGPAAPGIDADPPVDARAVAPTIAALLGVPEAVDPDPDVSPVDPI